MNVPPNYQMPPPSDVTPPGKSGVPGWAKWAIGCGAMVMCCCPVGGAVLFPVFSQAKVAAQTQRSLSNLRDMSAAMHEYSSDFDDVACPLEGWNLNLAEYGRDENGRAFFFADPLEKGRQMYGLNLGICGLNLSKIEDMSKVIEFGVTSQEGVDLPLTPENLRPVSNQPYRSLWVTVDGAAKKALIDEAKRLQWKPTLKK